MHIQFFLKRNNTLATKIIQERPCEGIEASRNIIEAKGHIKIALLAIVKFLNEVFFFHG